MATARFWKKWLRLGEWWLRRRITSVSSLPIVFRQSRLRALLPNETTRVPCVAAKLVFAHLRRCAPATGTLERNADTTSPITMSEWHAHGAGRQLRQVSRNPPRLIARPATAHCSASDLGPNLARGVQGHTIHHPRSDPARSMVCRHSSCGRRDEREGRHRIT
jgi:hypothetical protein